MVVLIVFGVIAIPLIIVLIIFGPPAGLQKQEPYSANTSDFTVTHKVDGYLYVDNTRKKVQFGKYSWKKYDYKDILNYELLENGNTVTKGGVSVGRAVAGGVLFGGVGAIIGGTTGKKTSKPVCTSISIKITLNDLNNPTEYLYIFSGSTEKDSYEYTSHYSKAQEILSILDIITNSQ